MKYFFDKLNFFPTAQINKEKYDLDKKIKILLKTIDIKIKFIY